MTPNYLNELKQLSQNSYSPYSNFKVAAVIVTKAEKLIKGVNIENIAYGEAICAERTALTQAYTLGYCQDDLKAIHIYSINGVTPCGSCRQVMSELLKEDAEVFIYDDLKLQKKYFNWQLLPDSFNNMA